MKKTILAIVAVITMFAAAPQNVYATATGNGVKVLDLTVNSDASFWATFSGDICNDAGAVKNIGQQNTPAPSGSNMDGFKEMVSMLQAAKLSGRTVVVGTNGYTWGCVITSVRIF